MKYFFLAVLATLAVGCQPKYISPHHVGIRSGVEWEIQGGYKTKIKPNVHGCLDWNL